MSAPGRIGKIWVYCIAICISNFFGIAIAQQTEMTQLPSDKNRVAVLIPVFTEREADVGSPFLSKKWIRGTVELENHNLIPAAGQVLLFNYDKINNRVYVINESRKEWYYPIDSVSRFDLVDNSTIYSFEKVHWISTKFFLVSVLKSGQGYSLYKRLITKHIRASYLNEGYFSTGKKYDEYLDDYEYYLVYPGNPFFRKLFLRENLIRRMLRNESGLLDEFFSLHDHEINEESLIGIIQYINDNKYPE